MTAGDLLAGAAENTSDEGVTDEEREDVNPRAKSLRKWRMR